MNATQRTAINFLGAFFLPILIVVLGVDYAVYSLTMEKHRAVAASIGYRNVEKANSQISHDLDTALNDLTMFALTHEAYDIYHGEITQDIEDTFSALSINRRVYDAIAYLSRNGRELFRVNYNDGSPHVLFKDELRTRANQKYFREGIRLKLDALYISPMSISPVRRAGESRNLAMLHLAAPVPDEDGAVVGVLSIDLLSNSLLESLADITRDSDNRLILLSAEGQCLTGAAKANGRTAESKFGTTSFAMTNPTEWAHIGPEDNGQFTTDAGLFTFTAIDLGQTIREATRLRGAHKAPRWILVAWTPQANLERASTALLHKLSIYSAAVLLLAAFLIVAQAVQRARRSRAEALVLKQIESNQRFVPKEFLGLLHKTGLTEVDISDNVQRTMTTLFTDIRSYTKLSEGMSPKQVLDFLNAYYQVLDPIITKNGGFIDAFIGDAVMALFPDGSEGAIRSAIEIQTALGVFRHKGPDGSPLRIKSGFGLHCGEVTIGAVGTDRRMQTTAIGDAVNLAARIESSTKVYGVGIIISGDVHNLLSDPRQFHIRSIDRVRVKGKQAVVELHEVFDADPPELLRCKLENHRLFEVAMRHYRKGSFEAALGELRRYEAACPDDPLTGIYIKRCNTMMRISPGDEWTGVSTM